MKPRSQDELSRQLSDYLDGSLNSEERSALEQYLAGHPEAAEELRDLRKIKHLLASKEKLPSDSYFWSRLSARMMAESEEESNLLPFPRKYIPLASAMGILAVVAVSLTVFLQREPILGYFSERSQAVKEAVETSLLKGSVLPLFAGIDNDKVLEFALSGTLPLDEKAETALRVDDQSDQGYHIEVGMTAENLPKPVTVKDLYQQVKATDQQVILIDSLLGVARARIVKGAFYAENNALAVDPGLTKLGKEVVSNIAAVLAPVQRQRFDRFLNERNASYAVAEGRIDAPVEPNLWQSHQIHPEQFVVITAESTAVVSLKLNIDSLVQSEVFQAQASLPQLQLRLENLMKARFRNMESRLRAVSSGSKVRTVDEEDFFKVEIPQGFFPAPESMGVWVRPRPTREKMFRWEFRGSPAVPFIDVEMNFKKMDSLVRSFNEEQLRNNPQLREMDSILRSRIERMRRVTPVIPGDTINRR